MNGELALELLIVAFLILFIVAVAPWEKPRRPRHHEATFDGTHATCSCGHNRYDDWDLSKHLKGKS